MIKSLTYKGPLVLDDAIPGESKAECIVPAHSSAVTRLSHDRWILFYATLDPDGFDSVRSIVYQIRADAPDGPVITRKRILEVQPEWFALNDGYSCRKCYGMPVVFGVPKGATLNGELYRQENLFVLKWYTLPILEKEGKVVNHVKEDGDFPEYWQARHERLTVEWLQFSLNDNGDDIEIVEAPSGMVQRGYFSDQGKCEAGDYIHTNHAMTPPVASDETCTTWVEVDTFRHTDPRKKEPGSLFAPIAFNYNPKEHRYEWTCTGKMYSLGEMNIMESSTNRIDDTWYVAMRGTAHTIGNTFWFRTKDIFGDFKNPYIKESQSFSPRQSYLCGDGQLRMFINNRALSKYEKSRNPLHIHDVHPQHLEYDNFLEVCDGIKEGLAMEFPFVDMAKLSEPFQGKQILVFRTIDHWMTGAIEPPEYIGSRENLAIAGLHYAEITYDQPAPDRWDFGESNSRS